MSGGIKYMFDTWFEDTGGGAHAAAGPGSRSPAFTAKELAAAREEGFAKGETAGLDQARRETERAIAGALAEISQHLAGLRSAEEDRRKQAAGLALVIGRKLATALLRRQPLAEIEALVGECLAEVTDEPRVVIRIDEALLDGLKRRLDRVAAECGYDGDVVVLGDVALKGSDCRIEWADGGAERTDAHLFGEIEAVIERFMRKCDAQKATAAAPGTAAELEAPPAPEAEPPTEEDATASTAEAEVDAEGLETTTSD